MHIKLSHLCLLLGALMLSGCDNQYRASSMIQLLRGVDSDPVELIEKAEQELESIALEIVPEEAGEVIIQRMRLSLMIRVDVIANDPNAAAELANQVAERFVSQNTGGARIVDQAVPPSEPYR